MIRILIVAALAGVASPALKMQRTPTRVVPLPPPPKPAELGPLVTPRVVETPTRARGNIAAYVSDSDYPPSAIRAQEQGRVAFRLGIGADGRVSSCTIVESSGSATLDETTCRILQNRARFAPARDARGDPVEDSIAGALNWTLPPEPPPPPADSAPAPEPPSPPIIRLIEPLHALAPLSSYVTDADYPRSALRNHEEGIVGFRLIVGTNGHVRSCTVTSSSGSAALDSATCRIMRDRAQFRVARDDGGNPIESTASSRIRWSFPE